MRRKFKSDEERRDAARLRSREFARRKRAQDPTFKRRERQRKCERERRRFVSRPPLTPDQKAERVIRDCAREVGATLRWWVKAQGSRWLDPETEMARSAAKSRRQYRRHVQKHIERSRLRKRVYYAALRAGDATESDLSELRAETHCGYCGRRFTGERSQHIDHITPLSRDGRTTRSNLIAACVRCNATKGAKPFREWLVAQSAPVRERAMRSVAERGWSG